KNIVVQAKKNLESAGVNILGAIYSTYSSKSTGSYSKYSRYNYYEYYTSDKSADPTAGKSKKNDDDDVVNI
ncbi:MAG: hypothetical protein IJ861_11285, partial [Clostridia bacterium]|nr:hypothetical protein [Clostridia bacterium]